MWALFYAIPEHLFSYNYSYVSLQNPSDWLYMEIDYFNLPLRIIDHYWLSVSRKWWPLTGRIQQRILSQNQWLSIWNLKFHHTLLNISSKWSHNGSLMSAWEVMLLLTNFVVVGMHLSLEWKCMASVMADQKYIYLYV